MIDWQPTLSLPDDLAPALYAGLVNIGSLTAYLSKRSKKFQVNLLQESWHYVTQEEAAFLAISPFESVKIREVQLCCDQRTCVYARTLLSSTLLAQEPVLQNLANTSLGEVLFIGNRWQRSSFQFAQLTPEAMLYQQAIQHLSPPFSIPLWARRSSFISNKRSLLIYEVFLPVFEAIVSSSYNNLNLE